MAAEAHAVALETVDWWWSQTGGPTANDVWHALTGERRKYAVWSECVGEMQRWLMRQAEAERLRIAA